MLTFDNVRFQYDSEDFSIIDHLSFTVDAGAFVCETNLKSKISICITEITTR